MAEISVGTCLKRPLCGPGYGGAVPPLPAPYGQPFVSELQSLPFSACEDNCRSTCYATRSKIGGSPTRLSTATCICFRSWTRLRSDFVIRSICPRNINPAPYRTPARIYKALNALDLSIHFFPPNLHYDKAHLPPGACARLYHEGELLLRKGPYMMHICAMRI